MGAVLVISCDHAGGGVCDANINGFVRGITDEGLTKTLATVGWKEVQDPDESEPYYYCPIHCNEDSPNAT